MSQFIKPFDERLKEYYNLIRRVRDIHKKGLDERNSYRFYIYLDSLEPLIEHVTKRYKMNVPQDIIDIIDAYG